MDTPRIFIDGAEGTTGLQIHERLARRDDVEVLRLPDETRKDPSARRARLNECDVAILCLPDAAARESVGMVTNPRTRIIDASSVHRVAPGWVYGLPELVPGQRDAIRAAKRVSVPGCHATGFVLIVRALVARGILPPDFPVAGFSLTGYSGGGKKLIATYEAETTDRIAMAPYALTLAHKHLPEMRVHGGLSYPPLFQPIVGNLYQGMLVGVQLEVRLMPTPRGAAEVHAALAQTYADEPAIRVMPLDPGEALIDGMLSPTACNGTNRVDLFVVGHESQVEVFACLDNLGKGASGGAVQCLNLLLGRDEFLGLDIGSSCA